MLYTSRYSNPELKSGKYTTVRISIGTPRWEIAYELVGAIAELMPFGFRNVEDKNVFRNLYYEKLDRIGIDKIAKQLMKFEALGKPVVLLCFEDVRKPEQWCHRTMFADWWHEKIGKVIEELIDVTPVKK